MPNSMMNSFENLSSKVSFWNVDLPKNPLDVDEGSEDLDVLCELVRNQYLKRLRQTLLNNLDDIKCYENTPLYRIQQCVDLCMAEMEKRALRRCMIASIYRECMSNMINEVKTCTNNSVSYVLLKHFIESNDQLSLHDKYFGAEYVKKQSVSIGINTEVKFNKTISTQTERWMDPEDNNKTAHLVTDILNKSITSSSYNVKSEISESNIFENLNSLLKSSSCSPSPPSDSGFVEVNKYKSPEFSIITPEPQDSKKNILSSYNTLLKDLLDSPEYESSFKLEECLKAKEPTNENHKFRKNIPELVTSVQINPNVIRPNKITEILKDKLKSSRVAKNYELRKCMNELPQELQTRLNHCFFNLFGNDHNYESDPLSEEEERIIAHKRIVKMVVVFMTPYYKAHRIDRHLFKILAKLISKNLMNRGYDPDEKTVARAVNEFFTGNRCIKTAEDIYM